MKRVVKVKKEQYVKAILLVVNQLGLNMTPSELSIIVTSINRNMLVFNLITRKALKGYLNIDSFTFNNYIKKLKDKGVLMRYEKDLEVNRGLLTYVKDKEIHLTFEIDDVKIGNKN